VRTERSRGKGGAVRGYALCYEAEPVGLTSLWSVVSSVNVKVFEDEVLLG